MTEILGHDAVGARNDADAISLSEDDEPLLGLGEGTRFEEGTEAPVAGRSRTFVLIVLLGLNIVNYLDR
jgi:hypothetical protein